MKIRGVIFDFNGVIVDDYPLQKTAWDKISRQLRNRPATDSEMLEKIRGVPTRDTIRWMSGDNLVGDEINQLVSKKSEIIRNLYLNSSLFKLNKGLEVFLNKLKEGKFPMTIATSSNLEMVMFSFKRLRLERWFSFKKVVYNDGKHEGKPAPGPYLLSARKLKIKASACTVFEDSKAGIISAHAAGIGKIIAVGPEERLMKISDLSGVTHSIRDFTEIKVSDILL